MRKHTKIVKDTAICLILIFFYLHYWQRLVCHIDVLRSVYNGRLTAIEYCGFLYSNANFFRTVQKSAERLLKLFRTHLHLFFAWNIARRTEGIFDNIFGELCVIRRYVIFCLYWINLRAFRVKIHAILIASQLLVFFTYFLGEKHFLKNL